MELDWAFDVDLLIQAEELYSAKKALQVTPVAAPPPVLPAVILNGALFDAPAQDSYIEGEDGPCLTLSTPQERQNHFYLTYMISVPGVFPIPSAVVPDHPRSMFSFQPISLSFLPPPLSLLFAITEQTRIYFLTWEDYVKARDAPWSASVGKIDQDGDYDPYCPVSSYYHTYYAGLGIKDPETRQRIKELLIKEGIKVTEVVLSKNEELLAIYLKNLLSLVNLAHRKITNGFIILPPKTSKPLSSFLLSLFSPFFPSSFSLFLFSLHSSISQRAVWPLHLCPNMSSLLRTTVNSTVSRWNVFLSMWTLACWTPSETMPLPVTPLIVADDIVLFLPHTRRGSSATTPYGFLWVKSLTARDFFLTQAVDFKVKNVAIIFKVPERISLFPFPLTLYPSLFPSFDSS
jgi:hypothetical protein